MNSSSSIESMLAESVEDFFSRHCDLQVVRCIEAGASSEALWRQVLDSGYPDALVSSELDGSGLSLSEAAPIIFGCGRHAMPLPLAQTMVVRAALSERAITAPNAPITIASHTSWNSHGAIEAIAVPYAMTSEWVLVSSSQTDYLLPMASASRSVSPTPGGLSADLQWNALPADALQWPRVDLTNDASGPPMDWRVQGAAMAAAQIAGAMARACEMTISYANERVQFGKPIGRQQVIQQQISVLAEQLFVARSAAEIGLCPMEGSCWRVDLMRGAVAKARAAEAFTTATAIAHAVHGAIGISEEYDLQMLTRHMHEWRLQYGSEGYWNARIGAVLLQDDRSVTRFIQQCIAPVLTRQT